jgi:hypothetical protein
MKSGAEKELEELLRLMRMYNDFSTPSMGVPYNPGLEGYISKRTNPKGLHGDGASHLDGMPYTINIQINGLQGKNKGLYGNNIADIARGMYGDGASQTDGMPYTINIQIKGNPGLYGAKGRGDYGKGDASYGAYGSKGASGAGRGYASAGKGAGGKGGSSSSGSSGSSGK